MTPEEFAELHALALRVVGLNALSPEEELRWEELYQKADEIAGTSEGLVQ